MKKVLLLLINGFETFEASVFIDVIGWNLIDGSKDTKLFTCGQSKEVKSSFDQKMVVDFLINEIDVNDYDALAIPGGFEEFDFYPQGYNESILKLIREFDKHNKTIATICVASIIAAKSGILKNRKATTYNKKQIRQDTLRSFGVDVVSEPIVCDANFISCWNPSTALDVAFILLERLTNTQNTLFIKNIMGFCDE